MTNETNPSTRLNRRAMLLCGTSLVVATGLISAARAQGTDPSQSTTTQRPAGGGKPNIVVIWGDDIGISNLSCYSMGLMGYHTPNIDRIAREGMQFTDYYGEQSCTAGRSSFVTGQSVFRTGLSKVGVPASPVGLSADDPTIAEMLKPLGCATGQFGKNHLGDLNKFCPRCTASTSSTAISTTGTPRRSLNFRTIPSPPISRNLPRPMVRAV